MNDDLEDLLQDAVHYRLNGMDAWIRGGIDDPLPRLGKPLMPTPTHDLEFAEKLREAVLAGHVVELATGWAHMYDDGTIWRNGRLIGTREDLEEVEPA